MLYVECREINFIVDGNISWDRIHFSFSFFWFFLCTLENLRPYGIPLFLRKAERCAMCTINKTSQPWSPLASPTIATWPSTPSFSTTWTSDLKSRPLIIARAISSHRRHCCVTIIDKIYYPAEPIIAAAGAFFLFLRRKSISTLIIPTFGSIFQYDPRLYKCVNFIYSCMRISQHKK